MTYSRRHRRGTDYTPGEGDFHRCGGSFVAIGRGLRECGWCGAPEPRPAVAVRYRGELAWREVAPAVVGLKAGRR